MCMMNLLLRHRIEHSRLIHPSLLVAHRLITQRRQHIGRQGRHLPLRLLLLLRLLVNQLNHLQLVGQSRRREQTLVVGPDSSVSVVWSGNADAVLPKGQHLLSCRWLRPRRKNQELLLNIGRIGLIVSLLDWRGSLHLLRFRLHLLSLCLPLRLCLLGLRVQKHQKGQLLQRDPLAHLVSQHLSYAVRNIHRIQLCHLHQPLLYHCINTFLPLSTRE